MEMIKLTENAVKETKRLIEQQNKPGLALRVSVQGGGCSGLSYMMNFDTEIKEWDKVFEQDGLKIVCDAKSYLYLNGITVDYSNDLVGGGFRFDNPNATGSCGCGTSFSA